MQEKYARDLLMKTKMLGASNISTLIATSTQESPTDMDITNPKQYRSIVGGLQYLTLTRPDIVQAVNRVCQHLQQPTIKDFKAVK